MKVVNTETLTEALYDEHYMRHLVSLHNSEDLFYALAQKINEQSEVCEIEKIKQILQDFSQIDGAHHKAWCLDQIARVIYGKDYENFVKEYCEDGEYEWDCGIAP